LVHSAEPSYVRTIVPDETNEFRWNIKSKAQWLFAIDKFVDHFTSAK